MLDFYRTRAGVTLIDGIFPSISKSLGSISDSLRSIAQSLEPHNRPNCANCYPYSCICGPGFTPRDDSLHGSICASCGAESADLSEGALRLCHACRTPPKSPSFLSDYPHAVGMIADFILADSEAIAGHIGVPIEAVERVTEEMGRLARVETLQSRYDLRHGQIADSIATLVEHIERRTVFVNEGNASTLDVGALDDVLTHLKNAIARVA